jgi:hypothetical protein
MMPFVGWGHSPFTCSPLFALRCWRQMGHRFFGCTNTCVIVPAESAYFSFPAVISKTPIPYRSGKDVTYPVNTEIAMDYLYKIPDNRQKYIAAPECRYA